MGIEVDFENAVRSFWDTRLSQHQRQIDSGKSDTGARSAVTGGKQMALLEELVVRVIRAEEIPDLTVRQRAKLQLPGFYRPEKKWDIVALSRGRLVCALEFKSHVGPSFGNNINNRVEEAVGNAVDFAHALREGRFGDGPAPILGYFLLLEDCSAVNKKVRIEQPNFNIDPEFQNATYAQRYELFCQRLVREKHYDSVCLTLATRDNPSTIRFPAENRNFDQFIRDIRAAAQRFG